MKKIDLIAVILLIIGGINWGLWGIVDVNVVDYIFPVEWIRNVIYFFIGVSGIYVAFVWKNIFSRIKKSK